MRKITAILIALMSVMTSTADNWDVRNYVAIPDPLNQGTENVCWAHASTSAVMASWGYASHLYDEAYVEYPESQRLSTQHMVDNRGFNTKVSEGGSVDYAIAYYGAGIGPKIDVTGGFADAEYYVGSVEKIPYSTETDDNRNMSISLIKAALQKYGAVSVAINTNELASPYYDASNHSAYMPASSASGVLPNHAVVIVGYDDEYNSFDNLAEKPTSSGAWIVRNSYGTEWGDEGYCYLSYQTGTMNEPVAYTSRIKKSDANKILTKDRLGATGVFDTKAAQEFTVSIFTNEKAITIKAIGIYTVAASTIVSFSLKRGSTLDELNQSSSLIDMDNITIANPGYHVIELTKPVTIEGGTPFGLVMGISNEDGSNVKLALESTNSSGTAIATNNGGQYFYYNGKFYDVAAINSGNANLINKIYCKEENSSKADDIESDDLSMRIWNASEGVIGISTERRSVVSVYDVSGRVISREEIDGTQYVAVGGEKVVVVTDGRQSQKIQVR